MGRHTPLYDTHVAAGAKMVDFAGWDMPLHYGSQLQEHRDVRSGAGMFDVSHMTVVDLAGDGTEDFLRHLLANDVARLREPGKALYSCMLNDDGGVIDDLIVYYLSPGHYRMVVNAATREKDLAWLRRQAEPFDTELRERDDLAMIAVQGPRARERFHAAAPQAADRIADLRPFFAAAVDDWFIARTGYTGEDGYEVILPGGDAAALWEALAGAEVAPCGLGARDSLRLEAGLALYGQDMDETVSPLECGLAWTVAWEPAQRAFIGRDALERQRAAGVARRQVGLVLDSRGVLRHDQPVHNDAGGVGVITSGGFSPALGRSVALALVPADTGDRCTVDIREREYPVRVVRPPFVRHGKVLV